MKQAKAKIFEEFMKGRGLPVGTIRTHGGQKVIKTGDGKWKRYAGKEAYDKGKKYSEKIRGKKGTRPESGVSKRAFTLFSKKNQKDLKHYLEKGKFNAYNSERGIPKNGKVLILNPQSRKIIGEAHTKKGTSKIIDITGKKFLWTLAYVPNRGRPSPNKPRAGSVNKKLKEVA